MAGMRARARSGTAARAGLGALRALIMMLAALVLVAAPALAQLPDARRGPSGLPIPRFVSLKSDRINVRAGPGQDHRIAWIYERVGLPVEITAEYDNWRRIRDSEGDEGWIHHSLLSGRRTALIAPWSEEATLPVRLTAARNAAAVALVEPKVQVDVERCDGSWCRIAVAGIGGFIEQELLWGVYPGEIVGD